MAPGWLTVLAAVYLAACFACAGAIAWDIFPGRRRQPIGVMNAVYPITALYFGPLAFYWRWARPAPGAGRAQAVVGDDGHRGEPLRSRLRPGRRDLRVRHLLALALAVAGEAWPAEYIGDYLRDRAVRLDGHHDIRPVPGADELMPSSAAFWLLMQAGMIIGFATSWPANVWLVKRGIKIPM